MKPSRLVLIASTLALATQVLVAGPSGAVPPQVLRVGTWNGIAGNVSSLDAALNQLQPGGWILLAPGDYRPVMDYLPAQQSSDVYGCVR